MDRFVRRTKKVLTDTVSVVDEENGSHESENSDSIPATSGGSTTSTQEPSSSNSKSNQHQFSTPAPTKGMNKFKRTFQDHWCNTFPWLLYDKVLNVDAAFCKICKEAYEIQLVKYS